MIRFRDGLVDQAGAPWCTGVVIDVAALDVLDPFGFTTIRSIAGIARLCGTARGCCPHRHRRDPAGRGAGHGPARDGHRLGRHRGRPRGGRGVARPGAASSFAAASMSHAASWRALVGLIARSPSADCQFKRWRPRPASSGEAGAGVCASASARGHRCAPLGSYGSPGCGGGIGRAAEATTTTGTQATPSATVCPAHPLWLPRAEDRPLIAFQVRTNGCTGEFGSKDKRRPVGGERSGHPGAVDPADHGRRQALSAARGGCRGTSRYTSLIRRS